MFTSYGIPSVHTGLEQRTLETTQDPAFFTEATERKTCFVKRTSSLDELDQAGDVLGYGIRRASARLQHATSGVVRLPRYLRIVAACLMAIPVAAVANDARSRLSEGGRKVRHFLNENGFAPDGKFEQPSMAFAEPSMIGWPHTVGDKTFFVTTFDPPPAHLVTLSAEHAKKLAAIFANPKTYNISFGGKACVFHPDVAVRIPGNEGLSL